MGKISTISGGSASSWILTVGVSSPGIYNLTITFTGVFLNIDGSAVSVNLNGAPLTPNIPSAKFNLNANDTIWLESMVSDYSFSTMDIKSYGKGDSEYTESQYWMTGGLTEDDGGSPPSQTILRKVIAIFQSDNTGAPKLYQQETTTSLQIFNTAILGKAAVYPYSR